MAPIWRLYYWPKMTGRGEYVRLILEEAKVEYENFSDMQALQNMGLGFNPGSGKSGDKFPCFAMPVVENLQTGFRLSQTPVICKYLGEKYGIGLSPELSEEDKAQAQQVNLTIHDYVLDGNFSYHMKDFHADYLEQIEYTTPFVQRFAKERIPKFLNHFENVLAYNKSQSGYLIGNKMTYIDLALLGALRVTEKEFPQVWADLSIPGLKSLKERLENRENLAAYFKSDRYIPLMGHSFM